MYIYHTIMPYEVIHKKDMRINTIICVLDNGCILTCNYNDFASPKKKLELFCYIKKDDKWKKIFADDIYTHEMWKYYRKLHKKFKSKGNSPKKKLELFCYIKKDDKWKKIFADDIYTHEMWKYYRKLHKKFKSKGNIDYAQMMKHDRKQKHGSGGSRIFNGSVTDYECTKYPMHDFPRSRYVQWN